MTEIEYKATPDAIALTPEQEDLMIQAIKHIKEAPDILKQAVRCQFWFRKIWDIAYEKGRVHQTEQDIIDKLRHKIHSLQQVHSQNRIQVADAARQALQALGMPSDPKKFETKFETKMEQFLQEFQVENEPLDLQEFQVENEPLEITAKKFKDEATEGIDKLLATFEEGEFHAK